MALQPVMRRSVPEEVFEQIAADVFSGEMRPGEALPSERRLAEVLGVSRPSIREGLKRLSAAGLVEVRHGGVTTVRDFRRHAGLDLLPRLLLRDGELEIAVVRSVLEAWLRIGPKVAELAAERHEPELAGLLEESLHDTGDGKGSSRVAASSDPLLGSGGRRRQLDRISVDIQRLSRRIRAGAACPGRRGRPLRSTRLDDYRKLAEAILRRRCPGEAKKSRPTS